MKIAIEHITRYRYAEEANYSIQSLRLTPQSFIGQQVLAWKVSSEPASEAITGKDGFGNISTLIALTVPHKEIVIRAEGVVEVEDRAGIVAGLDDPAPARVYLRQTALTKVDAPMQQLVAAVSKGETLERLHALMGLIRDRVDYETGATSALTPAAEALAHGKGVCQDHAHIFIGTARHAGIPCRYVTGYLLQESEETEAAHHAWAEAWVDGLGWVGFDVANRLCPTDHYVRLAGALDANYAAPIRGSRRGGEAETLGVKVVVREQPRQRQKQSQNGQSQQQ